MKNWKTTSAGIISGLMVIGGIAVQVLNGGELNGEMIAQAIGALVAVVALFKARDPAKPEATP